MLFSDLGLAFDPVSLPALKALAAQSTGFALTIVATDVGGGEFQVAVGGHHRIEVGLLADHLHGTDFFWQATPEVMIQLRELVVTVAEGGSSVADRNDG